jgi:hypothetical protein
VVWAVSSIKDSLLGWLGVASDSMHAVDTDRARNAMLELLLFEGMGMDEPQHLALLGRIRYARDLEALWYLRPELVSALAAQHGERLARERVNALAPHFGVRATAGPSPRSNSLMGR